jgi:CHAT domain-containing protein
LQSYVLAEKLLTLSRGELDLDESKWNLIDSNFGLYEQAISLIYTLPHLSKDNKEKCFFFIESSKSKTLSDALSNAEFTDPLMASDSTIKFLSLQKKQIHRLRDQANKLNDSTNKSPESERVQNAIIDADRKIELAETKINQKYPTYLASRYQQKLPSVDEAIEYTKKNGVCIVEYFWGTKDVYGLGIYGDQISLKRLGSSDELRKEIGTILQFLATEKNTFDEKTVNSFAHDSHRLYKDILEPFNELVGRSKRLVIIPDGMLSQIPFEILVTSDKLGGFHRFDYLLKSHIISYSFSSAYLLKPVKESSTGNRLLAFGFTDRNNLSSSTLRSGSNELTYSNDELQSLQGRFSEGKFLSGSEATEANFKELASDYDLLHLAIHGQGDVEKNYSAALFFRDSSLREDGKLHWYELFGLHLNARLAVISSCESGIGKEYRGEGMLSMANAFAYAGCSNIVMGMWKVNDRVSAQLMDEFYENISNGIAVDEALVKSKREYLLSADELTANPKLWASLVTYGNQRIMKRDEPYFFYLMILVMAGLTWPAIKWSLRMLKKRSPLMN